MEGVYAQGVVMAIAIAIVIILAIKINAATIALSVLLFVGAVIVHVTPIFPVTIAKTSGEPLSTTLGYMLAGVAVIGFVAVALCHLGIRTDETIFGWMVIGSVLLTGAVLGVSVASQRVFNHIVYENNGLGYDIVYENNGLGYEYATQYFVEPSGAISVLYENNKGITVEKNTNEGWKSLADIDTMYALNMAKSDYRVAKDDTTMQVPNVKEVELVEINGFEPDTGYYGFAKIRIVKVTLVEMEHKQTLAVDRDHIVQQWTTNKLVVEYEVTNPDEVRQQIQERTQQTQTKEQVKEQLQQLVTPTKGE